MANLRQPAWKEVWGCEKCLTSLPSLLSLLGPSGSFLVLLGTFWSILTDLNSPYLALLGLTGPFLHLSIGLTNRLTDWLLSQPKSWNIKIAMKLVQTFPPLNCIKRHFFNKLQQRWCKDPFIFIIVLISLLRGCFRHKSRWLAALAGLLPPGDDDTRDGRLMDSIRWLQCPHTTPQQSLISNLQHNCHIHCADDWAHCAPQPRDSWLHVSALNY